MLNMNNLGQKIRMRSMLRSRKFCQRGSNFDNVFLVDEGREGQITTISGLLSARQTNAIKWRFSGGPIMVRYRMLAW